MLGVSVEFSKMEGFAFDAERGVAYVAMSTVRRGMEDMADKGSASSKYDQPVVAGGNDVRLPYNDCGCGACSRRSPLPGCKYLTWSGALLRAHRLPCTVSVSIRAHMHALLLFSPPLRARFRNAVYRLDLDAQGMAVNMTGELCGSEAGGDAVNVCGVEGIANPDNLAFVHGHDGLLIAEDSTNHEINFHWFYNTVSKTLTRLASVPYGAQPLPPD